MILLLLLIAAAAFVLFKYSEFNTVSLKKSELGINAGTSQEGYQTIALFGVDSRDGEIDGGTRTDTIMLLSICDETGEIRVASVYRDSLLQMDDGSFNKANAAYASGGPAAALSMLNRNLDLDITEYITVDFASLADCIDLLGGVEIEVTDEEAAMLNQYVKETGKVAGKEAHELDGGGLYNLDGTQAVTYARLRKLAGSDYKRTERQRLVLEKMFEKMKSAGLITLNNLVDTVAPQISTDISLFEVLRLAVGLPSYHLGENCGFPFVVEDQIPYNGASVVIPVDLAQNVEKLHEFLYDDASYEASGTVQEISGEIETRTGVYPEDS